MNLLSSKPLLGLAASAVLLAGGLAVVVPSVLAQDAAPAAAPAVTEWTIDPVHSSLVWSIRHNGVSNVWGRFNNLGGAIVFHPDHLDRSSIRVEVPIASIDTAQERRDNHLLSDDFFKSETYPTASFVSTKIEHKEGNVYTLHGDLTLLGVTKPLHTTFELLGETTTNRGETRTGAEARFTIDRTEFGMGGWDSLGTQVPVVISIQAIKKQ